MFKNLFIGLVVSAVSAQAFAGVNSEYWYQAGEGESFVEGDFTYDYLDLDSSEFTDLKVNVKYEMGLSETVSWYGSVGYGQGEFDSSGATADFNGVEPINLGLRIQNVYEKGRLVSGFNLGYELEEADDDNRNSDVITFTFGMGYEHSILGDSLVGFYGSYVFLSTDREEKGSTDVENTNGDVRADFYFEKHMSGKVLGAKVGYKYGNPTNAINYTIDTAAPANQDSSTVSISPYGRYELSERLTLTGEVFYSQIINGTAVVEDDSTGYGATVGARFKF